MTKALVAFGGNLGNPAKTYAQAQDEISATPGITEVRCSPLYRTDPVGGPDADLVYLNGAFSFDTGHSPESLFKELQRIQLLLGRTSHEHWGPRAIDLDLVWMEETVHVPADLVIPHPRMHHRWFVLQPVADVAPEARHPLLRQSMNELLDQVVGKPLSVQFLGGSGSLVERCHSELRSRELGQSAPHCPVLPIDVTFQRLGKSIVGVNSSAFRDDSKLSIPWQVVFSDQDEPQATNTASVLPAVDARAENDDKRFELFRFFLDSLRRGSKYSHEE